MSRGLPCMFELCPLNPTPPGYCARCGWNPEVAARRKKSIRLALNDGRYWKSRNAAEALRYRRAAH